MIQKFKNERGAVHAHRPSPSRHAAVHTTNLENKDNYSIVILKCRYILISSKLGQN